MTNVDNPYEKVRRKMVAARIEFLGQLAKINKSELKKRPMESGPQLNWLITFILLMDSPWNS